MVYWSIQKQSYRHTNGLILDPINSGFLKIPNSDPSQQVSYLWWRHDTNSPTITGHSWWENTSLPKTRTDGLLGLEDLVFLKFSSGEASYNYYLIFANTEPNIFKAEYQTSSTTYLSLQNAYNPSRLEYFSQFVKTEYQNLTPERTQKFRESQETQIRELLYIANHQCCTCAQPAASCPPKKVPESTPTASLLLLGIFGIILLLKHNLKPAHHEKTKLL